VSSPFFKNFGGDGVSTATDIAKSLKGAFGKGDPAGDGSNASVTWTADTAGDTLSVRVDSGASRALFAGYSILPTDAAGDSRIHWAVVDDPSAGKVLQVTGPAAFVGTAYFWILT